MPRSFSKIFRSLSVLCLAGVLAAGALGQEKTKPPKLPKSKVVSPVPGAAPAPGFFHGDQVTSERSMMVDGNVAIKFCVAEGDLKINGWRRDEVRVFVKNGRKFHLKPLEKSAESGKVNWLWIGNIVEGRPSPAGDCLAGQTIEIDAPVGASVDISGYQVSTTIDSLKKVSANIRAGSVTLRNISGGISVQTGRGDMLVENSAGSIELTGYTGNIVVAEVKAGQIGDLFKVKTNSGAISMQRVEHRQIQANSISGSLVFDGKFLPGGIYNFRTQNGTIRLAIPVLSSCTLTTTYGGGSFHSEIPLKIKTQNVTPEATIEVSTIGKGDSTVNLTTSTGTIQIRKQE